MNNRRDGAPHDLVYEHSIDEDCLRTYTDKEVTYLREVLGPPSTGMRVLDLGCGTGGRAIALSRLGYLVTGIDCSTSALIQARAAAEIAGVDINFLGFDFPKLDVVLPVDKTDAVILTQSLCRGRQEDYLRLLQAVRNKLTNCGVLILNQINPFWIARNSPSKLRFVADMTASVVDPRASYPEGQHQGQDTFSRGGDEAQDTSCEVRLYTVTELTNLVRSSGFEVKYVHSDFDRGRLPALDTRFIQVVAAPSLIAPISLSLNVHHVGTTAASPVLNLKWSPDEVEWLEPSLEKIWSSILISDAGLTQLSRYYPLTDPWGSERAAPVISEFFGVELPPESIVFGAGATGLLRQIAPAVKGGRLLSTPLVHRDFPLWAIAEGAQLEWMDECNAVEAQEVVAKVKPTIIHIDRPSAIGTVMPLDGLTRLCQEALRQRALVTVDEAYLAYFAGADSAVSLVPEMENLIVIRSLSKAYCCGGLRVGFAVGGTSSAHVLRRLVAPLQVSEIAFQLGLRLMRAGDIFRKLRKRISEAKVAMTNLLVREGFTVEPGHENLPWVMVEDVSGCIQAELVRRGIEGKRLVPFSPTAVPEIGWLRLSVPLSAERLTHLHKAMGMR